MDKLKLTTAKLKEFAVMVATEVAGDRSGCQLIPISKRDLLKGCVIRFRLGTTF